MSTDSALAIRQSNSIVRSMDDAERAAVAMAKSGYFQDSREAAQALVKVLAGQEMGFGPFASMTGIFIIQGRPSVGANLMAAAVKGSGRYNYRVTEMSETKCSIKFYEGKEEIGTSSFTIEEAKKAGTKNLDKFPRNMLFARAMSNGVRWYCPDVFNGSAVYTPEELGASVNEEGEVIDVPASPVIPTEPVKQSGNSKAQSAPNTLAEAQAKQNAIIDHVVQRTQLPRARVVATLNKCLLPGTATTEQFDDWWDYYRGERGQEKSPDDAARAANESFGLIKPEPATDEEGHF